MKEQDKLRMNLQFFADQGEGGGETADQPAQQAGDTSNAEETKTFTQEDVNNIAAREAKKAQEKFLKQLGIDDFENAKEGLKKFKEWQDSQKTEAEKQAEQLKAAEAKQAELTERATTLEAQVSALKAGVNADSVEDVVALAKVYVNDDTDITAAIEKVVEKYPHFKTVQEQKQENKPTFTTGQHQKQPLSEIDKWKEAFK